jgi:hypothetical protein|tara:strand:- start:1422 stop:1865 length:444 start_codon:yes stop_codon:yes gene_type:complete
MSYFEQIKADMYSSMKSGDKEKTATLRTVLSILKAKRIDKRDDLTEAEELKELRTFSKQRNEAMDMFEKGGRNDLVQKELNELNTIEHYLPKMMDEKSIRELIQKIIIETGASGMADMGKVMPQIMKAGGGLIDGRTAQTIVGELLS